DKQINYNQTIDEKIDANYSGNRKIRSDAIRHVDGIITSDSDFFKGLTPREERQFFKDSLEFLKEEYGEENMVYATVHVDEKTPHMHFGFVPLTDDGRLSAKEKLGNKKAMTELQDRFNSFIKEQGHDLERGISKSLTQAEHKQMETLKKETDYHESQLKEIQEKYKKIDSELDELVSNYHESVQLLDENIEIDYDNETEKGRNFMCRVTDEFETCRIVMNKTVFDKMKMMVETGTQSAYLLERF
ncbi:MobV family relaxase, partial [Staphylococcus aureus]|uniref:MobV family relaxase n=1 Tax=Staphylococcus aureus TaxID=1280 RepID=UPI001C1FD569